MFQEESTIIPENIL